MARLNLLITTLILLITIQGITQPFESITSGITGVGRSYMAWGDYDNDGDLDVVVCGITTAGDHVSKIYQNADGSFTDIEAGIKGIKDGSLDWGDYDNDGDLDLLITGETYDAGNLSLIYTNNGGIFEIYDAGFPAVAYGQGVWGDYDNDGDLDALITGEWHVKIYNNDDGVFTLDEQEFIDLQSSKASWGDFDNDGDLDLLLIGDTGSGYASVVYINDNGTYTLLDLGMEGLFSGTCDWVDFDKDGDMDICISGYDIYFEPRFMIYENLGDGTLALYPTYLPGVGVSTIDWGDYDNDGDLDLITGGKNASCGGGITYVYVNEEGTFLPESQANIDGSIRCCAAWADYDNDGDLDFLLTGMTPAEVPFTKLYRNSAGDNIYAANDAPAAPDNLGSMVESSNVVLSWAKASDDITPQNGLNYNLRIGTTPGGNDIISPMSDLSNGWRYIQAIGNTNSETSRMVMNLPEGTYYWSVQAIDQAFVGSEFAEEQSFTIVITDVEEIDVKESFSFYPNPARDLVHLNIQAEYKIFSMSGQEMLHGVSSGNEIDVSDLKSGIYYIWLISENGSKTQKLVIK